MARVERWHPGGGHYRGARWMPGGGSWDNQYYRGGHPTLVSTEGRALTGPHKGGMIQPQQGRTRGQEMTARAREHVRKMRDEQEYARDARAEAQLADWLMQKHVRQEVRQLGGIAPHAHATEGQRRRGTSGTTADEYRYLPAWAKRKSGLPADVMAERIKERFPGLSFEDENGFTEYLKASELPGRQPHGARRRRRGDALPDVAPARDINPGDEEWDTPF